MEEVEVCKRTADVAARICEVEADRWQQASRAAMDAANLAQDEADQLLNASDAARFDYTARIVRALAGQIRNASYPEIPDNSTSLVSPAPTTGEQHDRD